MLPKVVICGRPNVGKSTLFNQLAGRKLALVDDQPGVTRDWIATTLADEQVELIDTAGLHEIADGQLESLATRKALAMLHGASLILLVVDGRAGLVPQDSYCANVLRHCPDVPKAVVVNKCEALAAEAAAAEFHGLGFAEVFAVSAAHRQGLGALRAYLGASLASASAPLPAEGEGVAGSDRPIRIAILGRPNVGKSTLANRLLKDERMLVSPIAGTTIDSVKNQLSFAGELIELIDTAGIRRKGRIDEAVEHASAKMAREVAAGADVIIFMVDATEGVVHQDQLLASLLVDYGRATVVLINKADLIEGADRRRLTRRVRRDLHFLDHAPMMLVSVASPDFKAARLLKEALASLGQARQRIPAHKISRILREAVDGTRPPRSHGKRPALRYAHQAGVNPPVIVIHGRHVELIKTPYLRYLANQFSDGLDFRGAPIQIRLKESTTRPKQAS